MAYSVVAAKHFFLAEKNETFKFDQAQIFYPPS